LHQTFFVPYHFYESYSLSQLTAVLMVAFYFTHYISSKWYYSYKINLF